MCQNFPFLLFCLLLKLNVKRGCKTCQTLHSLVMVNSTLSTNSSLYESLTKKSQVLESLESFLKNKWINNPHRLRWALLDFTNVSAPKGSNSDSETRDFAKVCVVSCPLFTVNQWVQDSELLYLRRVRQPVTHSHLLNPLPIPFDSQDQTTDLL